MEKVIVPVAAENVHAVDFKDKKIHATCHYEMDGDVYYLEMTVIPRSDDAKLLIKNIVK